MLEIIIQFERPAFGLTIDADKSDIPRCLFHPQPPPAGDNTMPELIS
jgi:hypothetical protein